VATGVIVNPSVPAARQALAATLRLICGVREISPTALPGGAAIFFANHSSHLDFAAIWAALPAEWRRRVRPVAGRDYWEKSPFRRWLAGEVFRAVLIERHRVTVATNPLEPMLAALDTGASLIVFPEGTRHADGEVRDFKPGLFHLARARPAVPLVPVLLDNLSRVLPRGEFLPVPIIASVAIGAPLHLRPDEPKTGFLDRAKNAVLALRAL
jgi:1-acyl-sn-glycerol-3-phosphate acyltransferase